jgi:hypothetical protein
MDKWFRAMAKNNSGQWSAADGSSGGGGTTFANQFITQADQLSGYPGYANPANGSWYGIDTDGSTAGGQCMAKWPWMSWGAAGPQGAPVLPIPPVDLALYAYANMRIPAPNKLTTSPPKTSYVNLGTYVWAQWDPGTPAKSMSAYRIVATLHTIAGDEVVSVWAQPAQTNAFTVNAAGGTPSSAGCGITAGQAGSKYPIGKAPQSGPGVAPDCGVLYTAPGSNSPLSVTTTWNATWGNGVLNGPGQALPNGQGQITVTGPTPPQPVNVAEIQSINGAA